jgi:hypothetical protein
LTKDRRGKILQEPHYRHKFLALSSDSIHPVVIHFQSQKKQKKKLKESKTDSQRTGWLRPFAIKLKTADAVAAVGFLVSFWRCTQVLRGRGTPSSAAARKKANKQASKKEKSNTKQLQQIFIKTLNNTLVILLFLRMHQYLFLLHLHSS